MRGCVRAVGRAVVLGGLLGEAVLAKAGDTGGGDPVQVDLWQAGFTIAVFLALLLILSRTAFKPILRALQKREEFIRETLEQAKRDREEAEARLRQYEEQLRKGRQDASAIVAEGRRDAEQTARRVLEDARKAADAERARAVGEIHVARDTALKELYIRSSQLAMDMAGEVLKRQLAPEDHERLVRDALAQLRGGSDGAT